VIPIFLRDSGISNFASYPVANRK